MKKEKNLLLKKGKERLDDIRFWLAVLRNFDQFTEPQRVKINEAYTIINELYKEGSALLLWIPEKDEEDEEDTNNTNI
jgi:hypothetical protein